MRKQAESFRLDQHSTHFLDVRGGRNSNDFGVYSRSEALRTSLRTLEALLDHHRPAFTAEEWGLTFRLLESVHPSLIGTPELLDLGEESKEAFRRLRGDGSLSAAEEIACPPLIDRLASLSIPEAISALDLTNCFYTRHNPK